jgi:hypothetical protein
LLGSQRGEGDVEAGVAQRHGSGVRRLQGLGGVTSAEPVEGDEQPRPALVGGGPVVASEADREVLDADDTRVPGAAYVGE